MPARNIVLFGIVHLIMHTILSTQSEIATYQGVFEDWTTFGVEVVEAPPSPKFDKNNTGWSASYLHLSRCIK